ncbi:MAG: hypothetical protein R3D88_07080 [Alphaproteobacteria bacterium]|nr:hypothetical protein [Alphaproteobacteria bacterium]
MTRFIKITVLFLALFVGACTHQKNPMGKPLPDLTYDYLIPYSPYNGSVIIRQSAVLDPRTKQASQGFIKAPDKLIQRYAKQRFVTQDNHPELPVRSIFDVQRLSFYKKSDEENIIGILSGAAADYYTLDLHITLSVVQSNGQLGRPYEIKLKRELLIPDNTSLAEKEILQFEFLEKVMTSIDEVITTFMSHMK